MPRFKDGSIALAGNQQVGKWQEMEYTIPYQERRRVTNATAGSAPLCFSRENGRCVCLPVRKDTGKRVGEQE
ncbi:MAG TPA: hypothetical protein VGM01_11775 [Ktedonobacteraceae bacterium]